MESELSTTLQPGIVELLEQAGANIRGRRADCPDCSSRRTVSIDEGKQVFFCHHIGCEFHGGIGTLRKRLNIEDERNDAEKERDRRACERAHEAAVKLYQMAHSRQLELREMLRELGRLKLRAHETGPTDHAWNVLADVYSRRPGIERDLDALESDDPVIVFQRISSP